MDTVNSVGAPSKTWFPERRQTPLSPMEWDSLTVSGTGLQICSALQRKGTKPDSPCAAILIKVEGGKIMGSRWVVSGDLGQVVLSAHRLGGGRNKNVYIDCSDLAKFTFPSDSDPRTYGNLSHWKNGVDITSRRVE